MKKITSLLIAFVLVIGFVTPAFAAEATKEEYQAEYNNYKEYYNNIYVPAYNTYNDTLSALAQEIKNTDFTTVEEAQRVIAFLKDLKEERSAFFGTVDTVGTSRYVVPLYREQMYAEAENKNYTAAIASCKTLKAAVVERVNFLNGLKSRIDNFEIISTQPNTPPATTGGKIDFRVTSYNAWWANFDFTITNTSNQDITNWTLEFDVDGDINHINLNSNGYQGNGTISRNGGYMMKKSGNHITLRPSDVWQAGYLLPAGTSISFTGGGLAVNNISNAKLSGTDLHINFSK